MPREFKRSDRVADALQRELAELLRAVAAYAAGGYAALEAAPRTAARARLLAQVK